METEARTERTKQEATATSTMPIAFCFEGDFLVHLVNIPADSTAADVCREASQHVVGKRTRPRPGELRLVFGGEELHGDRRVQDAGIGWMDYVDIVVRPDGNRAGAAG